MAIKISVVTPSFNQARYLERTIASVLTQDYVNFEYLILDGGSSDRSEEIIKRYSDRLTFWRSEKDNGQAAAIHDGFTRSSGDVLCWVNSDDMLLPGTLAKVGSFFEKHSDCRLLIGNSLRIDPEDRIIRRVYAYPLNHKRILWWGTGFDQPASFWRRDLYFQCGGINSVYQCFFDYDLYVRMSKYSRIHVLDDFLGALRIHAETKTATIPHVQTLERERVRRENGFYDRFALLRHAIRFRNAIGFRWRQKMGR